MVFEHIENLKNILIIDIITNMIYKQYLLPLSRYKLMELQKIAGENNITIKVGFCDKSPLGVDTKEDFKKVSKEMK